MKLKILLIILIIIIIIVGSIFVFDKKQKIDIKRTIIISIDSVYITTNNTTIPRTNVWLNLIHNDQVYNFSYGEYRWGRFSINDANKGTLYEFSLEGFFINNTAFNFFESTNNFNITIMYDGNNKKMFFNEPDKVQVIMETLYSDKVIINGDDGGVQLTITLSYQDT